MLAIVKSKYNRADYIKHKSARNAASVAARRQRHHSRPEDKVRDQRQNTNNWYRRSYGITLDEFLQQIAKQQNLCPIGHHPFGPRRKGQKDAPCWDHDHRTGKNREIVCREHNRALGLFHDSVKELQDAVAYIKKHQGENNV